MLFDFGLDFVGNGDNFHLAFVCANQFCFVDHRVKAIIMTAECLQNLPYYSVGFVVIQCIVRSNIGRDDYGQYDIAALFALSIAHDTTDRLHHIHL